MLWLALRCITIVVTAADFFYARIKCATKQKFEHEKNASKNNGFTHRNRKFLPLQRQVTRNFCSTHLMHSERRVKPDRKQCIDSQQRVHGNMYCCQYFIKVIISFWRLYRTHSPRFSLEFSASPAVTDSATRVCSHTISSDRCSPS